MKKILLIISLTFLYFSNIAYADLFGDIQKTLSPQEQTERQSSEQTESQSSEQPEKKSSNEAYQKLQEDQEKRKPVQEALDQERESERQRDERSQQEREDYQKKLNTMSFFDNTLMFIVFILIWLGINKIWGYFFSLSELVQTSPFTYWWQRLVGSLIISFIATICIQMMIYG